MHGDGNRQLVEKVTSKDRRYPCIPPDREVKV